MKKEKVKETDFLWGAKENEQQEEHLSWNHTNQGRFFGVIFETLRRAQPLFKTFRLHVSE
jgi:hypothetical protein